MRPPREHSPPEAARRLLRRYAPLRLLEVAEGDLDELFARRLRSGPRWRAALWYWKEVVLFCLRHRARSDENPSVLLMWPHYLTQAWRTMRRHKGQAALSLAGLAAGLACFLLIFVYVQDERSYDRFHPHADDLYRVTYGNAQQAAPPWAINRAGWAATIRDAYPEVVDAAALIPTWGIASLLRYEDRQFSEEGFFWADSSLFSVFHFPLIQGDPRTALTEPYTIVLTASMARKYFGDEDPIGKVLNRDLASDYRVTGVVADPPAQSHIQFDFVASSTSAEPDEWANYWSFVYLQLRPGTDAAALEAKLPALVAEQRGAEAAARLQLGLQPVTDIHLRSDALYDLQPNSDITYVYLFTLIALLILGIAAVNFTNLATARAAQRAREVGLRKVLGAHRGQLVRQHLGEALLQVGVALAGAVLLAAALLPSLNGLTGKAMTLESLASGWGWAVLLGTALVVGLGAGSYPAFVLARFQPARVLKGTARRSGGGGWLRRGLVVAQFAISIFLIASTLVVQRQLEFVQTKSLGFQPEQVVALPIRNSPAMQQHLASFRALALQHPGVRAVSGTSNVPGQLNQMMVGTVRAEGAPADETHRAHWFRADVDFVETLGTRLVAGRNFSRDFPADTAASILINETAAQQLGWGEDAVGQRLHFPRTGLTQTVIGVVEDLHFASLHEAITPMLVRLAPPDEYTMALARVAPTALPGALDALRQAWATVEPDRPFEPFFLDQYFHAQYQAEARTAQLIRWGAGLAIVIACLGLFGLAAFAAQRRRKELGVRKVLGAGVPGLVALLSKEFALLVALGFALAVPLTYAAATRWLGGFAYHIDLGVGLFLLAGSLAFLIAAATVGYQALRAALANPVEVLRSE